MINSSINIKRTHFDFRYSRCGKRSNNAPQVVNKQKSYQKIGKTNKQKYKPDIMNVGTWNVKTMLKAGKLEEVKNITIERNIGILGLCEIRWQSNSDFSSDKFRVKTRVIYSQGHKSVIILIKKK